MWINWNQFTQCQKNLAILYCRKCCFLFWYFFVGLMDYKIFVSWNMNRKLMFTCIRCGKKHGNCIKGQLHFSCKLILFCCVQKKSAYWNNILSVAFVTYFDCIFIYLQQSIEYTPFYSSFYEITGSDSLLRCMCGTVSIDYEVKWMYVKVITKLIFLSFFSYFNQVFFLNGLCPDI